MPSRLAPCPYCKCPLVTVERTAEGGAVVACSHCGMSGPESVDGDEEEAVMAWNSLCRKLCRNCRQVYIRRIIELKHRLQCEGKSV